ncbi:MAG: signal peptidase II [Ktedonobacterales bacterium]
MSPARRNDLVMVAAGALLVVFDQLSKHWIAQHLTLDGSPIPIFGYVLELLYVQNTGVAFSMLSGSAVLFLFIAVAIGVIGWMYWRMRENGSLLLKLSFGLILGGAVGNLIDRVTHGYVVDFVHFQIPPDIFNFAVFNVADSGISIGVVLLAFLLWRGESQMLVHQPPADGPSASSDAAPVDASTTASSDADVAPRVRRRVASGR